MIFIKRGVLRKQQEAPGAAFPPWHSHASGPGAAPAPSLKRWQERGGGGRAPPGSPKALCEEGLGAGQLWAGGQRVPVPSLSPPPASPRIVPVPARMSLLEKQGGEEVPAPPTTVTTRTKVPESRGTATSRGRRQRGECWPWGSPSPERGQPRGAPGESLGFCVPQSTGTRAEPAEVTAAIPDGGAGGGTRVPPPRGALAPAEQGVHHEIAQRGACDGPQEDPGVVGHDGQHHHVAQHHLHHVEQRLAHVEPKPPGRGDGKCHQ